jgi:7,8-dihydroneopterin aldolase/epimerase/oxygenase
MIQIELSGLELLGYHGADAEEREEGQRFLFDVSVDVGHDPESDRLADTVDYREIVDAIREVSDGHRYNLLEALAAAVADELIRRFRIAHVRVRVRKPDVRLPVEFAAATVERRA